jgi:hypothetical protein
VADNELSCDGTFSAKDLDGNGYIWPMCTAGKLVVDTTALTMCAELTMHLLLPLLTMPLPLPLLCISRRLPSRPGTRACLACRDVSRNKFTKVEVTSVPSLTKLYGPDTRRTAHRTGHRACDHAVRALLLRRKSLIP